MQDNLQKIKEEVLDELIVITDETDMEPVEKFDITMTRYINSGDVDLLAKAHSFAKEITDPKEKGSALLQILEEINIAQAEAGQQLEETATAQEASEVNNNTQDESVSVDNQSK